MPGHAGWPRFPVVVPAGPGGHCPASGSGRSLSRSCCWRGLPGWEARLIASDPVRPSSAAQPWMKRPELVPLVQVVFAGEVGEGHGGDGAVAVQGPAGQPGHLPQVLAAGGQAGGVRGLVAGHGGVGDGQGHGSASRSGSGSRVRAGPASRSSAREGGWPGRQPRSWSTTITYVGRSAASGRGTAGRRVRRFPACPALPAAGRGCGA